MSNLELAKRFMDAVGRGDEAGARDCMQPDAEIWHNFDNVTQTVDENMALMQLMIAKCGHRSYHIHRFDEVEGGYVQRHRLDVSAAGSDEIHSVEVLALIMVTDGRISRVEEFMDPEPVRVALAGG